VIGAIIGDVVGSVYEFNNHRSKEFFDRDSVQLTRGNLRSDRAGVSADHGFWPTYLPSPHFSVGVTPYGHPGQAWGPAPTKATPIVPVSSVPVSSPYTVKRPI